MEKLTKEEIINLSEPSWQKNNNELTNGVNPFPYQLGFLNGYRYLEEYSQQKQQRIDELQLESLQDNKLLQSVQSTFISVVKDRDSIIFELEQKLSITTEALKKIERFINGDGSIDTEKMYARKIATETLNKISK